MKRVFVQVSCKTEEESRDGLFTKTVCDFNRNSDMAGIEHYLERLKDANMHPQISTPGGVSAIKLGGPTPWLFLSDCCKVSRKPKPGGEFPTCKNCGQKVDPRVASFC